MENILFEKNWKSLIKPSKVNVAANEDKSLATLTAEPLEKGYALTLGNALRRVLLSSIQGTAVSAIQIDGVLHEFSSIKGVREDVTDIVLNIKSLSMMRSRNFAKDYGVLIVDGPLAGITARAVVVIDKNNIVIHSELVKEIADEPDYDGALNCLT